jgi:hypothetical protein
MTHDWRAFDALTDAEILKAARSDPDAQPLNDARLKQMSRPNPKVVRQAPGCHRKNSRRGLRFPWARCDWEQGVSSRIRLRAPTSW